MDKFKSFFVNSWSKTKTCFNKVKEKYNSLANKSQSMEKKIDSSFELVASPFKSWFIKYRHVLIALFILILATGMKYAVAPYYSNDYYRYLQPWIYQMHLNGGGIRGLISLYNAPLNPFEIPEIGFTYGVPSCDYPPLYMYLLSLISYFPGGEPMKGFGRGDALFLPTYLYGVKTISFIFDALMALFAYKIVKKVTDDKVPALIAFTAILFLPTANINSAMWGQCDVIYSFMVVASIYYIMEGKQIKSVLLFALSLSLKLQGIFILPLFGFLWFRKSFRLRYLLFVPITMLVTFLPLYMGGASFLTPFMVYKRQLTGYSALNLNSTSIFTIFQFADNSPEAQHALSIFGMIMTVIVCFITISALAIKKVKIDSRSILTVSTFFVIIVPFLLPHMHERYFYLADIVFVIYACTNVKRIHLPIMMQISSIIAISCYGIINTHWFLETLGNQDNLKIGTVLNLISIAFLIYDLVKLPKEEDKEIVETKEEVISNS